jgi:GxxExxY protein
MKLGHLTNRILGGAINVHSALGPGLLESAYRLCLHQELMLAGLRVELEWPLPLTYRGLRLDAGYRIDLRVEEQVIVELKSVKAILPVHEAQLLSYLKLSGCEVGLLINFNVVHLRDGIIRRVL